MEGVLLSAGVVAVLVGLGALVEVTRQRRRGSERRLVRASMSRYARSLILEQRKERQLFRLWRGAYVARCTG
jgi:hypothetical protein